MNIKMSLPNIYIICMCNIEDSLLVVAAAGEDGNCQDGDQL